MKTFNSLKVVDGFWTLNGKRFDFKTMSLKEKFIIDFHFKKQKEIYYGKR
jgi:hypothetical protein